MNARPRLVLGALDAVCVALAFVLAYLVAFDVGHDPEFAIYARQIVPLLPVAIAARLAALALFGLYRDEARVVGGVELVALGKAIALGTAVLVAAGFALRLLPDALPLARDSAGRALRLPWRIVVIEGAFALLLLGAARFGRRMVLAQQARRDGRARVLVVGDGPEARGAIHQMLSAADAAFTPAALLVSEAASAPTALHGVPVERGDVERLGELLAAHGARHVLLAPSRPDAALLRRAVRAADTHGVRFHLLPSVESVMAGGRGGDQLRDLRLEDLLRRDEVPLDLGTGPSYVAGKTVLITGAGGSIGGELARQLAGLSAPQRPARLVLLDRAENSLFDLERSLSAMSAMDEVDKVDGVEAVDVLDCRYCVGGVDDAPMLAELFDVERPHVVFHAAAHKHVPLMEAQPAAALANNTLATSALAALARERGVERFVFISTDKAVRPSSIMGASKRLAERAVWLEAEAAGAGQHFCAVRFGNVLGSRGSVVPVFQEQIAAGGPLTLTHPDMTRYFMTGPEAASLVIMAGGLGANGHLYLLDMGEPIKLVDLARDLIRLSGSSTDEIELRFTGPRPGEKIFEELLLQGEGIEATRHPKIRQVMHEPLDGATTRAALDRLGELLAGRADEAALRAFLREQIADYAPPA